jgi:hypothetical protein
MDYQSKMLAETETVCAVPDSQIMQTESSSEVGNVTEKTDSYIRMCKQLTDNSALQMQNRVKVSNSEWIMGEKCHQR